MSVTKINTVGDGGTFEDAIADAPPKMKTIARAARKLIATVMPGVTEVPWVNEQNIGYGVGPKKMSEHFAYIMPHKSHVNLGFMYGADLEDPSNLLEGTGKKLRHIKLRTMDDLNHSGVKKLMLAASKHLPKLEK